MPPVLRKKPIEKTVTTTFRAPRSLVEELDQAVAAAGLESRNDAILQLLRYGLAHHWRGPRRRGRATSKAL